MGRDRLPDQCDRLHRLALRRSGHPQQMQRVRIGRPQRQHLAIQLAGRRQRAGLMLGEGLTQDGVRVDHGVLSLSATRVAKRNKEEWTMEAGFLGVGNMGQPMAGKLLDGGHSLTIYDISEAALQPLLERQVRPRDQPQGSGGSV